MRRPHVITWGLATVETDVRQRFFLLVTEERAASAAGVVASWSDLSVCVQVGTLQTVGQAV